MKISKGEGVAAFALVLGIIVILQILGGAYGTGFRGDKDEAAHLVTSLMVRDFIAGLDYRHPWQFAQQYYYHYPMVSIGRWPPVFYGALGIWFLIVGTSRGAAMVFIAIVSGTTASVIYFIGRRLIGRWAGILAAILFVASPLVQDSSAQVMTEHLRILGMLVSTLCFARFARTGQISDGLTFGIVAALAILTHGSAWALGLVPGITLALTNRWYLLRQLGFWLAATPVLVACVPWYVFTISMLEDSWVGNISSFWIQAVPFFARSIYLSVGLPILIFAMIGVWEAIIRVKPRAEVRLEWAALAALAVATFILHCVAPGGLDGRYMTPAVPPIVLFSTAGINGIAHRFGARLPIGIVQVGLVGVLIAAICANGFSVPLQLRNGGYGTLIQAVTARLANIPQVWLISSGVEGESCFVAAFALHEQRPKSYILRAKTILAGGDFYWNNMEDRFDTPRELARLLDDIPITIIVIDDQIPPSRRRPYQDRLRQLLVTNDDKWEPIGSYPQTQGGIVFPNSLHVYARRPVASLSIAAPKIRIDLVRALMVRKELR
jgi:4-amino-4-deoxy-L-arabinose transferase-like glycosyltransferase